MKEILCLSGGLDSLVAWYYLGKPSTIYFNTNQPHSAKEIVAVKRITNSSVVIDNTFDFSEFNGKIYIPHRNLLFASAASKYAEKVWIAGLHDDMVEDKSENAFNVMSICLSTVGKDPVTVDSPFWSMTKTDVCRWFLYHSEFDTNDAIDILVNTSVSCYSDGILPCYACESCYRKACTMYNSGVPIPFLNRKMVEEYYEKAKRNHYISKRNDDIIRYSENYLR